MQDIQMLMDAFHSIALFFVRFSGYFAACLIGKFFCIGAHIFFKRKMSITGLSFPKKIIKIIIDCTITSFYFNLLHSWLIGWFPESLTLYGAVILSGCLSNKITDVTIDFKNLSKIIKSISETKKTLGKDASKFELAFAILKAVCFISPDIPDSPTIDEKPEELSNENESKE